MCAQTRSSTPRSRAQLYALWSALIQSIRCLNGAASCCVALLRQDRAVPPVRRVTRCLALFRSESFTRGLVEPPQKLREGRLRCQNRQGRFPRRTVLLGEGKETLPVDIRCRCPKEASWSVGPQHLADTSSNELATQSRSLQYIALTYQFCRCIDAVDVSLVPCWEFAPQHRDIVLQTRESRWRDRHLFIQTQSGSRKRHCRFD